MDETFLTLLAPLARTLRDCPIADPKAARAWLDEHLPFAGATITAVRAAAVAGAEAGWLLPKRNGTIRFGRVAKDLEGFSVDAVWMSDPGPKHRHPNGEIDLCFAIDGAPRFDGNAEGWTVYGPDTTHVPTVRGGTMLILYFLPGGAIEFLPS
ncbi:MAG: DUF4863 family protein [Planctomycetes bacterium]|nr:DUF4863 family protein [Planctomycetota bacterium]